MPGPYVIGVDCGTQSAKVVAYDVAGRAVAEGRRELQPMSRPRHGVAVHPDDDVWDVVAAACRAATAALPPDAEIAAAGPLRDPLLQGVPARGRLPRGAADQLDGRPRLPAVPPRRTRLSRTRRPAPGYLAHRLTGALRDTAANNILLQWPIDTDTWQWSDDAVALRHDSRVTREMLAELQLPGDVIGPLTAEASAATGLPAGTPVVQTANDKAVEALGAGTLGRADGARLARHLHRRDGARPREPQAPDPLLDELRLRPAPLPLREPRHPARDVDADVVPRPARRRGGRGGAAARA